MDNNLTEFQRLLDIMDRLRAECPWDSRQTFDTLRCLTIEEVCELSEAILSRDATGIREELGDLMLHIVFYAKIASEQKLFTMTDILKSLCDKLVMRHPHVYGNVAAEDMEEVHKNWEKIKLEKGNGRSVLGGVPAGLSAMIKAYRIQDKARGVGFDWHNSEEVWDKVTEELAELRDEVKTHSDRMEDEFGDVLFALVNYARFIGVHPDDALEKANRRFIRRFQTLENLVKRDSKNLVGMSLEDMEVYWQEAKSMEKKLSPEGDVRKL